VVDKRKQRIASILIGIGIVILILVVGMKIISRRGQATSDFTDFNCNCTDNKCNVKFIGPCKQVSIQYGGNYIADPNTDPTENTPGSCQHNFDFTIFSAAGNQPLPVKIIASDGNLLDNADWFCSPSLASTTDQQPTVEPTEDLINAQQNEPATVEPTSIVAIPTPSLKSAAEQSEDIIQWYQRNRGKNYKDCAGAGYSVLMCVQLDPTRQTTPVSN